MQTQDLVVTCPEYFGRYWVDQAADHHGIAHLLFHPAHIQRPGVADALRGTIEYGREKGLQWWTSEQVNEWERARRSVKLRGVRKRRTGLSLEVTSARPIQDATLLVLNSRRGDPVERYGFRFGSVVCDIEGETEVNLTAGN